MNKNKTNHKESIENGKMCFLTKKIHNKYQMLRFVVGTDDTLYFDVSGGKLPGRGMWLSSCPTVLDTAIKKNVFSKIAKKNISIPEHFKISIKESIQSYIFNLLNLARKSHTLVLGYQTIKKYIQQNDILFVIGTPDASEREKNNLIGKTIPFFSFGTKDLFSSFSEQETQTYLALRKTPIGLRIQNEFIKLQSLSQEES